MKKVFCNVEFLKLFFAQIFSHFSDAILQFTIIAILIDKIPQAGKAIAITFFAFLLPQFLLSPVAGTICDKFPRKMVLVISSIYRAIILSLAIYFFILPENITPLNIYLTAFMLGIGSAFFYPAKMAIVTNIVEGSQLKFANAFNSAIGTLAILFGAFSSNLLVQNAGAKNSIIIIASAYLIAAAISSLINIKFKQKLSAQKEGFISDIKTAINYLKNHKRVLYLIALSFCIQFIVAAFSNNLNTLITDYYKLDFSALTILRTILGGGILLGLVLTVYFARIMKIIHIFASGFIILFITLFTANFCHTLHSAWIWLVPIGVADAMVVVMLDTLLQKITPDRVRGKIFGFSLTINTFSFLSGTLAIIFTTGQLNPLNTFKIIAATAFLLALCVLLFDKAFRYLILKSTLGILFLCLYKYKVEGIENLPKTGKVILAGNHTGYLDTVILQMATKRHLWFVTGPAAFSIPIVKHLLKHYNVLPLQFGKGLEAIEAGVTQLKKGEAVIIFPEGKLTTSGDLFKFNRGVAIMAKHADCPIVPFAIKGGYESWSWNKKAPSVFKQITIQFGQPITDLARNEKVIVKDLRDRVNFMKKSLDRRSFYNISEEMHSNFLELMQEKADIFAPVTALSLKNKDGFNSITYIELSRNAKKFANYLIETIKIDRGDRIAILSESRPEFATAMFASIQTGGITIPLDIKLTVKEHSIILSDCNPKVLCCSSHYLEHALKIKENVSSIEHIFVIDSEEEQNKAPFIGNLEANIEKDLGRSRSLDETALIVYTSGTTGNPKGVMISFGNIYSQFKDFEKILKLSSKNVLLSILPLNHLLELTDGFFAMLYMGAQLVYIKNLTPKELTQTMKSKQITNMIVVPLVAKMIKNSIEKEINKQDKKTKAIFNTMYKIAKYMPRKIKRLMFKQIIDNLGGKLECFISGGAPLEKDVAEFFDRIGIPIFQGYGLTETSPTVSTNYYGNSKIGTVGKPLPSVKVKTNEQSELLVSGHNIMQGYWNKPEMTREVIDEEGWFHTGDIAEIDKDGYIKITGRIKNMIVLGGGKKIFPEEVEAVLEHSNKIKEICVLSLKIKTGNKAGTEEVGAIIVPSDDIANCENVQKIMEDEVKTLAQNNLAPYKIPTMIVIHKEELPKTSTKKVKRNALLEWYENLS